MIRRVDPEWLDGLPPDDPRAVHSRKDLRQLNALMGHAGILAKALTDASDAAPPRRIVELGAGDGTLLLKLAGRLSRRWGPVAFVLVDRAGVVSDKTRAQLCALSCECDCVTADVFDWLGGGGAMPGDWMVANLFLHHFTAERLGTLLSLVARNATCFAACETRRSWFSLALSRMVGLVGCNAVSRHDAILSVRAGFDDGELSALWPDDPLWELVEGAAGWCSHRFIARRRDAEPVHHA